MMAPAPEVSPISWKLLEILVKPTFSTICLWGIMEIVGFTNTFPTISMIPETMAQAPEVSPDSWERLKVLVSPKLSTGTYFKTVLPTFATEQILCTRARCFANKAGKVFKSLVKLTSWSNTKLGNHLLEDATVGTPVHGFSVSQVQSYTYCMSTFQNLL